MTTQRQLTRARMVGELKMQMARQEMVKLPDDSVIRGGFIDDPIAVVHNRGPFTMGRPETRTYGGVADYSSTPDQTAAGA